MKGLHELTHGNNKTAEQLKESLEWQAKQQAKQMTADITEAYTPELLCKWVLRAREKDYFDIGKCFDCDGTLLAVRTSKWCFLHKGLSLGMVFLTKLEKCLNVYCKALDVCSNPSKEDIK